MKPIALGSVAFVVLLFVAWLIAHGYTASRRLRCVELGGTAQACRESIQHRW